MSRNKGVPTGTLALIAALALAFNAGASATADAANDCSKTEVVAAYNQFSVALTRRLYEKASGRSFVVSPLSVAFDGALLVNGAKGDTRNAILHALRLRCSLVTLNNSNASLRQSFELANTSSTFKLFLANGVWVRRGLNLQSSFQHIARKTYDATIGVLEFGTPSAVERINDWARKETGGALSQFLTETSPADQIVLTNALLFAGTWDHQFHTTATRAEAFHLSDGTTTMVPMMHGNAYQYAESSSWEIVRLAYRDYDFAAYAMLPRFSDKRPASLDDGIRLLDQLSKRFVLVSIPRVEVRSEYDLKEPLSALGMSDIFSSDSDFGNLARGVTGLYVTQADHRAMIRIDERGSEATATTALRMEESLMSPERANVRVRFDRPFLIVIRDDRNKLILFAASVQHP